jgi:hypothetical protein
MRPITIVLTIQDSKGSENQMLINIVNQDTEPDLTNLIAMATNHQLDIDALTDGAIVRCGLVVDVPIHFSLKDAAVSNSSNEAGATFIFFSDANYTTQFRIPAFVEAKILPGTPEVDLTDTAVQDLLTNIVDGYSTVIEGATGLQDVVDSRGEDVTQLGTAKEVFQRGRV